MFAKQATLAQSHLSDLRQSNAMFLANIREDQATGSTPRKRTWNVPASWQTTAPRDALLSKYRQMHADNNDYRPSFRIAATRMENLGGDDEDEPSSPSLTSPTFPTSPAALAGPSSTDLGLPSMDSERDAVSGSSTESEYIAIAQSQLQPEPLAPSHSQETLPAEDSPSTIPVELAKPVATSEAIQAPIPPNPLKMSRTKSALNRSTARAARGEDKENAGADSMAGNSNIPQRRVRRNM
jgi:kinesin family protein 11